VTPEERESFVQAALTLANKVRLELYKFDDATYVALPYDLWAYVWELEGVLSVLDAMPGETVTEYGVLVDTATGERKD